MKVVACKKMVAEDGKVCVLGNYCPFCGLTLDAHVEIREDEDDAEARVERAA